MKRFCEVFYFAAAVIVLSFLFYYLWWVHNDNPGLAAFFAAFLVTVYELHHQSALALRDSRIIELEVKHNRLVNRVLEDEQKIDELEADPDDDSIWG